MHGSSVGEDLEDVVVQRSLGFQFQVMLLHSCLVASATQLARGQNTESADSEFRAAGVFSSMTKHNKTQVIVVVNSRHDQLHVGKAGTSLILVSNKLSTVCPRGIRLYSEIYASKPQGNAFVSFPHMWAKCPNDAGDVACSWLRLLSLLILLAKCFD